MAAQMPSASDITHWIEQAKVGDRAATEHLWGYYFERLVRSVRVRPRGQDRAASDEEDVALSVFDSFHEAAGQGRFPDLADRDGLWRLLMRMASRKVIDKHRHDHRRRRGGREDIVSLDAAGNDGLVIELVGEEPSPEMAAMTQEAVKQFFTRLGVGELRELAVAKLEGSTNAEIAALLDCSERTVERRLRLIRERCEDWLNDQHPSKTSEAADLGS